MNTQINTLLDQLYKKQLEQPWCVVTEDAAVAAPVSADTSNEDPDALDMFLSGFVDSLMGKYDVTDEEAADIVFLVIDQAVGKKKLPELPDETADGHVVSQWIGKATTRGLSQMISKYASANEE